ncbi:MAG TPA: HNH endonuclease [Mycobacteriales bacterium]|nr:HNH endonuclease [Mycobacteriales bacterium]
MAHALVLNATYEPLCVVSSRRAVVLVLAGKAIPVEATDDEMHSEHLALRVPVVVRLTRFVRVPYRAHVPLTRRAVFARDGGRCVYCSAPATSIDHVVPRSRGGEHVWENVVSCCRRCNHAKADRALPELGWRMPRQPRAPSGPAWRVLGTGRMHPVWRPYLGAEMYGAQDEPASA